MAWEARSGLKSWAVYTRIELAPGLNGLGSPFGFEIVKSLPISLIHLKAKWPGKPVRV